MLQKISLLFQKNDFLLIVDYRLDLDKSFIPFFYLKLFYCILIK